MSTSETAPVSAGNTPEGLTTTDWYMAGIIRNWIIELDEATRGVLAGEGDG